MKINVPDDKAEQFFDKKVNGKLQKMTIRQLLDEWWKRLNDNSQSDNAAQEVNDEIKRRDTEGKNTKGNLNKRAERKYVKYFKEGLWKTKRWK